MLALVRTRRPLAASWPCDGRDPQAPLGRFGGGALVVFCLGVWRARHAIYFHRAHVTVYVLDILLAVTLFEIESRTEVGELRLSPHFPPPLPASGGWNCVERQTGADRGYRRGKSEAGVGCRSSAASPGSSYCSFEL
jgi:hypothetical protein